jgi:hypothetical protein
MKSKHTKGKAIIYNPSKILNKEESIGIDVDGISVLVFGSRPSSDTTGEEDLANAQLMVDAFNVTNETNMTPRELQKSHAELLVALERVHNIENRAFELRGFDVVRFKSVIQQAIKNAKQ